METDKIITKEILDIIIKSIFKEIQEIQALDNARTQLISEIKNHIENIYNEFNKWEKDSLFRDKTCRECEETYPLRTYQRSGYDRKGNPTFRPLCRDCSHKKYKTYNSTSTAYQKALRERSPERFKAYREKDKENQKIRAANWYINNKDHVSQQHAEYRKNNPEKEKERHARYYRENKEKIQERVKKFYDSNPGKKWALRCRQRVAQIFKSGKEHPELIGCSADFLQEWLMFCISMTDDENMTQESYGKYWHIDHTIPCKAFDLDDEEQKKQCFHWTNLAPLEKIENIKKGGKVCQEYIDAQNDRLEMFEIFKDEVYPRITFQARPTIAGSS